MHNIKRKKKGISPVIASIILIAITIAIAIAVAGWVFGLFGAYAGGGGVTVTVTSLDTDVTGTPPPVNIWYTVVNTRPSNVTIVSIRIVGDFAKNTTLSQVVPAAGTAALSAKLTAPTGGADLTAGTTYTIQFVLSDGTILTSVATAS